MDSRRHLIVNADDFGLSTGVNKGIVQAHEHGIVTSASLMVRWPAAAAAAAYSRGRPSLSVGLHVDLGEWTYRNGQWEILYQVVSLDDRAAVADELQRQLDTFRRLLGRNPSHIDSHQHVHREEPARSVLVETARQMDVPLRHFTPRVRYCGEFYGQTSQGLPMPDAITVNALLKILAGLLPGVTELACHPGEGDDANTMYKHERVQEVKTLCDPQVLATLVSMKIRLRSFAHRGA